MTVPARLTIPTPEPEAQLDSGPFEGPEKLLEVWFAPSLDALPDVPESSTRARPRSRPAGVQRQWRGLRRVGREVWEEMLDTVKCKVLSVVEGEELDAYLLR
jgi:S-adenosylmethionine decarboxylase